MVVQEALQWVIEGRHTLYYMKLPSLKKNCRKADIVVVTFLAFLFLKLSQEYKNMFSF